jgi:uncharacterized protein
MIGRKDVKRKMDLLLRSNKPEFVVVTGRRRIGKTYFVRTYFNNTYTFYHAGLHLGKYKQQLSSFITALNAYFPEENILEIQNWFEAFNALKNALEKLNIEERKVIFLDEVPWMDNKRSDFLIAFEHFWNTWASSRNDIFLVACGSANSWIQEKIINNPGGFHNRITAVLHINPFSLAEVEQFFLIKNASYTRQDIIRLYAVFGGVPFYLEQVNTALSIDQNIDNLLFDKKSTLANEFINLFRSLFANYNQYIAVVMAIATKNKGLTRQEIIEIAKLPNGGNTTKILDNLEACQFLRVYNSYGKKSKSQLYQLADQYTLFYIRFTYNTVAVENGNWLNLLNTPQVNTWMGYAFEQIVAWHLVHVKKALQLNNIYTETTNWIGTFEDQKAQIDLLIERGDKVISLIEIKYSNTPYLLSKQESLFLLTRQAVFVKANKIKKQIHQVLVSPFGVVDNEYAKNSIQAIVTTEDLFEDIPL